MNFVLFHANCDDGFGAAWAMWRKFGPRKDTVYVPVKYNEPPPIEHMGRLDQVWIVDFSYPARWLRDIYERVSQVILYDHHRTAFQELAGMGDPGPEDTFHDQWGNCSINLDNGHSGAGLTWAMEFPDTAPPKLISYIEDADLWKHELPQARAFKHMLRTYEYEFETWDMIANIMETNPEDFLEGGRHIERAFDKYVRGMAEHAYGAVLIDHPDVPPFLAVNGQHAFASDLGHVLALKSTTFGLVYYEGAEKIYCSLRANDTVDVSAIAKKFGGGGHKNAAGFQCKVGERPWKMEYAK